MKLIETKDFLLLIEEESIGIKYGEIGVNMRHSKLEIETRNIGGYGSDKYYWSHKKCIAYYPLTKEAKELDLPVLPNPFDPLERRKFIYLVKNTKAGNEENLTIDVMRFEDFEEAQDWCKGKSYLEIEQQEIVTAQFKQFSLKDMRECWVQSTLNLVVEPNNSNKLKTMKFDEFIQSLSTQQLPKEFIAELRVIAKHHSKESLKNKNFLSIYKTITNSEGKEELVGTYKY